MHAQQLLSKRIKMDLGKASIKIQFDDFSGVEEHKSLLSVMKCPSLTWLELETWI